jgi:hypothetical protein
MTDNTCGTCNACCRAFAIPDLKKAGEWCKHCHIGVSCRIYESRPEACSSFECLWLHSQRRDSPFERLSLNMRPDKCKVMFSATTNPNVISAIPTHGANLHSGPIKDLINLIVKSGMAVVVGRHTDKEHIFHSESGEKIIELTEADKDGMRWNKTPLRGSRVVND